jgi:hypothetical protein
MPAPNKKNNYGQWFYAGKSLGWSKEDGQIKRRRAALASRRGNYLKTARALQSLANITQDKDTNRKANADAKYFFMKHERSGK